ncbi:MAG: DoxX family membrane protein [Acidobacteriota bacterium]
MIYWAPLPLRLVIGIAFAVKGWQVLFMQLAQRSTLFAEAGLPLPYFLALIFGSVEFLGGGLLLLGGYVRSTSVLLLTIEIIAIWPVHLERGFIAGSALNLLLIGGLSSLILSGSGRLSLTRQAG